jgi:AsmA protein
MRSMGRILKIVAGTLGVVILLAVVAAVSLMLFVSPNRFKPLITEQVKKTTGRQLVIDGDLSWSFFPSLGVKVGHMRLENPADFQQKTFAEIDHATVSVKLIPLFYAHVESSGIALSGMKLYLVKNAAGKTNWQDLQQKSADQSAANKTTSDSTKSSSFRLAVSAIDVNNAQVSWIDEQAKKNFDVNQFELHAKNISLRAPFPLAVSFNVAAKNPNVSGKISLRSQITLNTADQIYLLKNTDLSATLNNIDADIKGDIVANLDKQTLRLENFNTQVANMSASGKMNVSNILSAPIATGSLQMSPFDLKAFLKAAGQDTSSIKSLEKVSGDVNFTVQAPKTITAQGKLKIDTVQTTKIKVTDVNVEMRFENNVLQLAPITAKLYEGDVYAQGKVDLSSGVMPQISLQAKMSKVQAKPLLEDLGGADQKIKLSGLGNVDFQIISAGSDSAALTRNLNGSGRISFNDGVIEGVDLGYMIDSAASLVQGKQNSNTNSEKTTFGSLTGTFNIQNGVMLNNDLHIDSPRFDTNGKGQVDLINKQINYSLQTLVKKISEDRKDSLMNFYGLPIPVMIAGSLEKPSIRLDTATLMQAIAQKKMQQVTEKVQAQIQDKIKDQLPENIKEKIPADAGKLLQNMLGQ